MEASEHCECSGLEFKIPMDYLQQKVKKLKSYTTKQEKDILLADDDTTYSELLELVVGDVDIKPVNELEAIYFLLRLRMISVSDLVEGMINCQNEKCKAVNEFKFELPKLDDLDLDYRIPICLFDTIDDMLDTDELPLMVYNKIQKIHKSNIEKIVKLTKESSCRVCASDIIIGLEPRSLMSKSTLQTIYQEYFNFGFYLHYSNRDVDSLLPFERSILHGQLRNKIEKEPTLG